MRIFGVILVFLLVASFMSDGFFAMGLSRQASACLALVITIGLYMSIKKQLKESD